MQLKIEHTSVDRLIPYARNARTHSEPQVSQIAGSIAEFGFVNPILVGEDDVSRWEQHTGGIAVLEADGSRFGSTIGQREA